jgi:PPE-repeat protein
MDFGAIPPEINSGRIYAGPGSGPMLTAAVAWDRLADDLYATSASYGWVFSGLVGERWLGPVSVSVAAAAAPYVTWMTTTAAHAEQAATQARAAAAAYEAALAMMVPPQVIADNRALLALLARTNDFGRNVHTIAGTEALYEQMWAQDATAMYGYAASSVAASTLAPFTPPLQAGPAREAAGVDGAVGTWADTHAALSRLILTLPRALRRLAQPSQGTSSAPAVLGMPARSPITSMTGLTRFLGPPTARSAGTAAANEVKEAGSAVGGGRRTTAIGSAAIGSAGSARPAASADVRGTSAGLGRAGSVAGLSVPHGWQTAALAGRPLAPASPSRGVVSNASTETPKMLSTGTAGYFVSGTAPR